MRARLEALETYVERTYTPLMADRLAGDSTAVVLFGPVSETVRTAIEATLRDSGASRPEPSCSISRSTLSGSTTC